METLFISIQKRIEDTQPDMAMIDEDYGQLQSPDEDGYPVVFPCVLINVQQVDWSDASRGMQMGDSARIVIKLAIDCYDDTHNKSYTQTKAYERMMAAKELHKQLQRFAGKIITDDDGNILDNHFSPLTRIQSRQYALPGGIKVYETTYTTAITDRSCVPELDTVPKPKIKISASFK
jgi:hypothetical protein